ncbi:acyl-CoA synthetase [Rhodococcus sp. HNM0563]|uniref:acyl-CoA synthetase n=1 Tax=Rhodococcus sp. HNM0563 TaxID=2716339 RepID=UPI00146B29ED|nr:acyl-CoA synthetase [Rhodococcus sp. HNM0563]NLU65070.1 acyl-CoA synthetase [Rhodococcus sp. HNM0563]
MTAAAAEPTEIALTPTAHALRTPDAPAIIMGRGDVVTYRELDDRSARFATYLRAQGLTTGDHIAILMENSHAFLEVAWAAQRSGLYYTAINRHLRSAEVQYILDDSGSAALITTVSMSDVIEGIDLASIGVRVCTDGALPGFDDYASILDSNDPLSLDDSIEGREMLYSSGTTGRPKGVRKPLPATPFGDPASPTSQVAQGIAARGITAGSVYLSPAPLYHGSPLVFCMSAQRLGATVVVMERFDPVRCLELIERHRVTYAQFVPTMFVRMLKLSDEDRTAYDLSSLQEVTHGAAPCPVSVKYRMIEWMGPIIHEYYSGTEDVGATQISSQEWLAHPGSVGRPMQTCHIVGEDGEELPVGEVGVVYFDGGRPFEYHNDPDKTAGVTHPNGWRTLGDMGYVDDEGYLYLTDRQALMIISGGVNIYPQETENILIGHPAVLDVAVIGIPDDEMGEAVKAVVQLVEPDAASDALADELLSYCHRELASYKCPRSIDFVHELPRDPNGKLYKRHIREEYWRNSTTARTRLVQD